MPLPYGSDRHQDELEVTLPQVTWDEQAVFCPLLPPSLDFFLSGLVTPVFACPHPGSLTTSFISFSSVWFSCSVMSDSLWPHGLQLTRPPCPSPTPGVYPNSCPLSRWCHPTISSSVVPFSSCLQCFPASGSFPMSQVFVSGGLSIGVSASVPPMNIQDWSPLGWTGWLSLLSKGLSRVFSNTTVQKHQFFSTHLSL